MTQSADIERIKALYEGRGEDREPFWSADNWGPLIPEIQFGEGQFRDLVVETLRDHGWRTADMARLSVIELGCGWGRNLNLFLELGVSARNIAGVDLIGHFIEFGRSQNPGMNLIAGDATKTTFNDGSFDIVLLHTVLSAILDAPIQEALLREARRLAKPGGLVIIYDIADHYPVGRTEMTGATVTFIQPVPRSDLCAMAADAGLAVARWRRVGLMPRPRKLIFRSLPRAISFSVRRALATLLAWVPGAASHYFFAFKPERSAR